MSAKLIHTLPFLYAVVLSWRVADAVYSSASPRSYSSSPSTMTEWRSARATYYAASDPRDDVGGACGYGDLVKSGYGMATVGLSTALFERGQICGACFELRCVDDLRWCIPGTSIIVTVTNFCAPNYGLPSDGGGHCNPPNKHFVLPIEAFEKIAIWKAANMPIQYRRYTPQTAPLPQSVSSLPSLSPLFANLHHRLRCWILSFSFANLRGRSA
uniref:Expansin n=1 Tax=Nelumbo nucifera TaxID=4432 RepID=A0A822YTB5_NELNU|nr:TPA_asm: hypothetical protein HUJ06_011319 [Nelumbo nucifera]